MNVFFERYPERLEVPMSDGGSLAVHRYAAPSTAAPVVLEVTPYRKECGLGYGWKLAERGYHYCSADVRGFGGSRGGYSGVLSEREIQDYAELIEWIARQPFCSGQVATIGGSYNGASQMLVAARRPKGLVCIAPLYAPVDFYRDWNWRGGIVSFCDWGMTYFRCNQAATLRSGLRFYYSDLLSQRVDNDAYRKRSAEYVLPQIHVPALLGGGWNDYFLRGTIRAFERIPSSRRLVVGPWGHGGNEYMAEILPWLDWWLTGKGKDPVANPRVRLFRSGSNEWIERNNWFNPKRAQWREWSPFAVATDAYMPPNFSGIPLPRNIRAAFPPNSGFAHWPELTTADSAPFAGKTVIDGPPALEAFVDAGPVGDYECHARLSVVQPDGRCTQLTEGRLLASHREFDLARSTTNSDGYPIVPWHTHARAERPDPAGYTRLCLEINPICHCFCPGDRLRLGLSLVRADEQDVPATARIGPRTRVLLPLTTGLEA
ncbi:MAG: CocE/NonD family hydrolase [Kiritimatiellae bacterium]|nr:CocE/NonD family hydrolase [Kiritimatiellia bacterium]